MNKSIYPVLRILFIIGNVFSLVLVFVPIAKIRTLRGAKLVSPAEIMTGLSQSGHLAEFLFILILGVVVPIVLIVLAFGYPRRWIFVSGAGISAFVILINLFAGNDPSVEILSVTYVLSFVVTFIVMITGFVIKPPQLRLDSEINQASKGEML